MANKGQSTKEQVGEQQQQRLIDALVEDILETSDDEILREAAEDYDDPDEVVARMKLLFDQAVEEVGKSRLGAAQARVRDRRRSASSIPDFLKLSVEEKRVLVGQMFEVASALGYPVTGAARNEGNLQESDLDAMLEAFDQLGLFQEDKKQT